MGLLLGHRWAWDEAGVLHRDVSITNIMFYRTLEGIIGVLCDWDLSDTKEAIGEEKPLAVDEGSYEAIDDTINYEREESKDVSEQPAKDDDSKKGKARYRTGTGPFMALDLLAPGPAPVHLYRHDLESFFWVLVYFVATHDPEQHTLGRINQWVDSNLQIVRHHKTQFLTDVVCKKRVVSKAHPLYKAFINTICWDLHLMFMGVENDRSTLNGDRIRYMNAIAKKDTEDEEYYGDKIIKLCDSRNGQATFKRFMKYLGSHLG